MKKIWATIRKHPIITTIYTGIIGAVIKALFTPTVTLKGVKAIWNFVVEVFTFRIPLWLVLLAIIFLFLVKWVLRNFSEGNKPLGIRDLYKTDIIEGVRWVWDWFEGYDGKLGLTHNSPHALCPNCQNELLLKQSHAPGYHYKYEYDRLFCDNCGFEKKTNSNNFDEYTDKIKREIYRRARTGEWNQSVTVRSS